MRYTTPNENYIRYLNTLHNVDADNPSAYTELSITNEFFTRTMVERGVGHWIDNQFRGSEAHIFVLTGHAGDGKTGILFQILKAWSAIAPGEKLKEIADVRMPDGRICRCIKDFSELEAKKRKSIFEELLKCPEQGKSAFLVANTGPLISTFSECFCQNETNKFVGAIDDNHGTILSYNDIPISVINVATVDNASFVRPYLQNVLADDLWQKCKECPKAGYCPMLTNRNLMEDSKDYITQLIADHYIWQQEYGNKLTIRQIVAHLAYTITGGLECRQVKPGFRFYYLCSNLFFGYNHVLVDDRATTAKAISDILDEHYDQKKLRADEDLFIRSDYSNLPGKVREILDIDGDLYHYKDGWQQAVKRAYIFLNNADHNKRKELMEDIFSAWYPRYLELRSGDTPNGKDKQLVVDAMEMLFLGSLTTDKEIPVTMRRDENSSQCVQLVYDSIQKKKIHLIKKRVDDFEQESRYRIYAEINGDELSTPITLPLINYFDEMRKGVIQTNIDPQLSQGVDSLRAQIISLVEGDPESIELMMITSEGWEPIQASLEDGVWNLN